MRAARERRFEDWLSDSATRSSLLVDLQLLNLPFSSRMKSSLVASSKTMFTGVMNVLAT